MKEVHLEISYLNDKFKIRREISKGKPTLSYTKDYDGLTTQVLTAIDTGLVLRLGISPEAKSILGKERSEALEILANKYNLTLTAQAP